MLSLFMKITLWGLGATGGRALERDALLCFIQEGVERGGRKERNQEKKLGEREGEQGVKRGEGELEVIRMGDGGSGW